MSKVPLLCGTYRLSQIEQFQQTDIVLHDKEENNFLLIDIVIPDDSNINTKEVEKLGKYKVLESEVSRMWK
jgi:hypothetical protein